MEIKAPTMRGFLGLNRRAVIGATTALKKAGAATLQRDSSGWQLRASDPKPHRAPPPIRPTLRLTVPFTRPMTLVQLRCASLRSADLHGFWD